MRHLLLIFLSVVLITGCTTPPQYSQRDSSTTRAVDNTIRYGSIAGVGAGAGYGVTKLTGDPTVGVLSGVVAAGATYGGFKFMDKKQQSAYNAGYTDGESAASASLLQQNWEREAVYGIKSQNSKGNPSYRTVYVPKKTVNGVVYDGRYQTVPTYK